MACILCKLLAQYALNWLNLIDHALNTLLLGDPYETVSARAARARKAGRKWAVYVCHVLTFLTKVVTFGRVKTDHCDDSLDPAVLPNAREIWDWSGHDIREEPTNTVLPNMIQPRSEDNAKYRD
ncbi:MAG: hypothetical protein ACLGIY_20385 [Betaproteobacteria bacterium]